MAAKRTGHVAAAIGDLILVWGGHRESRSYRHSRYLPVNELWVYDTVLEVWSKKTTLGTLPPGTSGAASFIFDNKMYIFGGYCDERAVDNGNTNAVYMLDLVTMHWHKLDCEGNLPLPCDKLASWQHDGKLFIFGGFGLNPRLVPQFLTRRFEFVADDSSQMIYPRGWNNQLAAFDPVTLKWSWPHCKGRAPIPRAAHAAAKLGNHVYVFGGRHQHFRMRDMHRLDLLDMTWSDNLPLTEPTPEGRSWHSLTPLNETTLVLYGGFSQNQCPLSDCWLYDTLNLSWSEVKTTGCQPRLWHTACTAIAGEIVLIGGCRDNILSHATPRKYAKGHEVLSFTPKSLLRLCLDAAMTHEHLQILWANLPSNLQSMLNTKMTEKLNIQNKCSIYDGNGD